jgi:AraC-like DNA-binding protein
LLMQYVHVLRAEGPTSDLTLARQVSDHMTDLVALALGARGDVAEFAAGRGVRAARLAAIKADILAKLHNRDLSIAVIAGRHGVTPRYVHKLFEREGTTFSAFMLQHRLARAQQMLKDRRYDDHTISVIAFECGFSDLSYFNRTFRRAYNATPSDIRETAPEAR